MPFQDDADLCRDVPPHPVDHREKLELTALGLAASIFTAVLFLGLRCALHRIEHTVALLVT